MVVVNMYPHFSQYHILGTCTPLYHLGSPYYRSFDLDVELCWCYVTVTIAYHIVGNFWGY